MLVITRKVDQKIQIGEGITITVLNIRKGAVKLGITGPAEVPITRDDIKTLVKRSKNGRLK